MSREHHTTLSQQAPALADPRPPLKVENEAVHDFEVHREGGYAKGHVIPGHISNDPAKQPKATAGLNPAPWGANTDVVSRENRDKEVAYGAPTAAAVYAADPRPPLRVENEAVHDFEVHREGAYAAGHTVPGANPEAARMYTVPGGPSGGVPLAK